ncbi:MAG: EAL domain-containing protein [Erysipelotrichaceae bacterium]
MPNRRHILLVEDNELNIEILANILEKEYHVLKACNGKEAIDILKDRTNKISLVMTDVNMPVMNGYELLDYLKSDDELSLIPVIVMTQSDSQEEELAALSHGANDFLPKPYRPSIILHRTKNLINFRETAAIVNDLQKDRLTGLYTKEYFYKKAEDIIQNDLDNDYSIICTNIENFKLYNDIFGQKAGDALLKDIASNISKTIGPDGICGRMNADRFLILQKRDVEEKDRAGFLKIHNRVNENVTMKWGVYRVLDRSVHIELMCDRAKLACDSIKGMFDTYVAQYDEKIRDRLLKEMAITEVMESALKEGQFTFYLQPKYNLRNNLPAGAEALVRWIHPDWGFMSPAEFIPLFEKNGFITTLDEYIWEEVFKTLDRWKKCGFKLLPVSVNVSRIDVLRSNLTATFRRLLEKYDVDPEYVHLELTESAYSENTRQIIEVIDELRHLGFLVEMDDFGSGYSSLNMFSQMNIDYLKLDMKFIQNELSSPTGATIINFIIDLAHKLDLKVVAEGVETYEHVNKLRNMDCDYGQGYFYSRPLKIADYEKLVAETEFSVSSKSETMEYADTKRHILLIDNDKEYYSLIEKTFGSKFEFVRARNIEETENVIRKKEHFDVIILNYDLDETEKISSLIRHDSVLFETPLLAIINNPSVCNAQMNLEGSDDFLCKHHPLCDLYRRVEALVSLNETRMKCKALKEEASHDYTTSLLNRRGLKWALDSLKPGDYPLGIYIFDIDNLKTVNDSKGHDAGDIAIKEFADMVIKNTRSKDIICRYGGDEFLLILKNINSKEMALKKGNQLCDRYTDICKEKNIEASCSCGLKLCKSADDISMSLIDKADRALYAAKQNGKGHCVVFEEAE